MFKFDFQLVSHGLLRLARSARRWLADDDVQEDDDLDQEVVASTSTAPAAERSEASTTKTQAAPCCHVTLDDLVGRLPSTLRWAFIFVVDMGYVYLTRAALLPPGHHLLLPALQPAPSVAPLTA
jgi:hypothetical protein